MTQEFEGTVRSLSSEGYGVVEHPDGRVFFAPAVWPGDRARFVVTSVAKRYGYARIVEMLEASKDRVKPPCPHQGFERGQCGGCPWMIGNYASQLAHKEHRLEHALTRSGLLSQAGALKAAWGSPSELGYRNRAQVKTNGEIVGFVSEGTRTIAPLKDCLVLNDDMRGLLRGLVERLPNPEWKPGAGHEWNFIDLDDDLKPNDAVALNKKRPFKQGNSAQNARMREWVGANLADLPKNAPIVELYAGSGNFTEAIAALGFIDIRAYEVSREAIDELNARAMPGVRGTATDLFHPAALRVIPKEIPKARALVLDPPRAGSKGVEKIVAALPKLDRVLYVSCDIATFVRDATAIAKEGFVLSEVRPLDLFPQTPHLELMARFERR